MHIAILSRGPQLYSTQSLYRAALLRGHTVRVIDLAQCALGMLDGRPEVFYEGLPLLGIDVVIPRIGTSVTQEGIALISQFDSMGVASTTSALGLWQARDKLRALLCLQRHGVAIPNTILPSEGADISALAAHLGGFPIVLKMIESTHGIGVMLAETAQGAQSTLEAFQQLKARVILQEFIREVRGTDIRALVVNGRVVASMQRIAQAGEFRSNLHRGGVAVAITLTQEEQEVAIKAAQVMGLAIAGVDMLRSNKGPLVMEVNASPGLEGIETTTGVDVAGAMLEYAAELVQRKFAVSIEE